MIIAYAPPERVTSQALGVDIITLGVYTLFLICKIERAARHGPMHAGELHLFQPAQGGTGDNSDVR